MDSALEVVCTGLTGAIRCQPPGLSRWRHSVPGPDKHTRVDNHRWIRQHRPGAGVARIADDLELSVARLGTDRWRARGRLGRAVWRPAVKAERRRWMETAPP